MTSGSKGLPAIIETELIGEWDYAKNQAEELDPSKVTIGSGKRAWWICSQCNHSWNAMVNSRQLHNCPQCANRKRSAIFSEPLHVTHPEFRAIWSIDKNQKLFNEIFTNSITKFWWKCPQNHFYFKSPQWLIRGYFCPYCENKIKKLLSGFNDLETLYPEVAKQWNSERNSFPASKIRHTVSHQTYWWKCNKGHEWMASPRNRTVMKSQCPECSSKMGRGEKELRDYIQNLGFTTILHSRKIISPYEIDIYIPELKIGIEFNGYYWHSDDVIQNSRGISAYEYHSTKLALATNQNLTLLFIWQDDWVLNKRQTKELIKRSLIDGKASTELQILEKPFNTEISALVNNKR